MFKILKYVVLVSIFKVSIAMAVNVAVIAPKNEDMVRFGRDLFEGVKIAVDIVNQNGGVLGEKINLIEVEDHCEDLAAVSTAKMLTFSSLEKEKLSLIIGPYCQNKFDEISEIYSMKKITRIIPVPLSLSQEEKNWKGLFKIGGEVRMQAQKFSEIYKKKFSEKNLAVVYDDTIPATVETASLAQDLFVKGGLSHKITLYNFASYHNDFEQLAKEILLNNQAVYLLGDKDMIAKLAQNLQEENPKILLFTDEYSATSYFFKEMGNFAEGVYFMAPENLKDRSFFTEDLVKLRLAGKEPRGLGIYGYAALKLWVDMVENAQSLDFVKISAQSENTSFKLPWGNVRFVLGKADNFANYTMYQINNGEYTQVN